MQSGVGVRLGVLLAVLLGVEVLVEVGTGVVVAMSPLASNRWVKPADSGAPVL